MKPRNLLVFSNCKYYLRKHLCMYELSRFLRNDESGIKSKKKTVSLNTKPKYKKF